MVVTFLVFIIITWSKGAALYSEPTPTPLRNCVYEAPPNSE